MTVANPMDRLPAPFGRAIFRSRPLNFTFEGRRYSGFEGDTVASALIANGVWLIGRSFKYHRPRSVLSLEGSDANLYVTIDGVPNLAADLTPLAAGMEVRAQNFKGSLRRDRWVLPGFVSRFLPVGFYYWAFFRPLGAWKRWEPTIRRRAGLGRIDLDHSWVRRAKEYEWADVAVIGGGVAGLAAAEAAAERGADVLLIDGRNSLAGLTSPSVRLASGTTVHGLYADGWMAASRGGKLIKIRARQVVLATGTLQQPAVFRNNDLPGIMLGDSVLRLVQEHGILLGQAAVVVTADAEGYAVAETLLDAGITGLTVVDTRPNAPQGVGLRSRGVEVLAGHEPVAAGGRGRVHSLAIRPVGDAGTTRTLPCDLVAMCGGRAPNGALWAHAGGRLEYDRAAGRWMLPGEIGTVNVAGALRGLSTPEACGADGTWAGQLASARTGHGTAPEDARPEIGDNAGTHPILVPHASGKDFVDFDEDLTVKDLKAAMAQGFEDVQLLKRYSTWGMGPSQGRHALTAGSEIVSRHRGDDPAATATTTFRPPVHGLSFAALAGEGFHPARLTPMDAWHRAAGARMMVAGNWWRPAVYPDGATADPLATSVEEARIVRSGVGLIDVSTLGKIEIRGPDAAAFLERFYTFRYAKQPVGRSRYLLATDETGAIVDDGVACRLSETHFYVTTTTGASDQIYRSMLWWRLHWQLDVDIANVTGAYAAINIAGPLSRKVLSRVAAFDIGREAFPYLAVRRGEAADVPVRAVRVGFVGELGFELHVPAGYGAHLWETLMAAGAEEGIRAFGVEAQRLLRLEKGHVIVGQDTDGLTFPGEANLDWAVADKPDFVGKRAIEIRNGRGSDRRLVGYRLPAGAPVPAEGHLTFRGAEISGRVTSRGRDLETGAPIGLAFVHPDQAAPGTTFQIRCDGGQTANATVVELPFYDPDNMRQELDP